MLIARFFFFIVVVLAVVGASESWADIPVFSASARGATGSLNPGLQCRRALDEAGRRAGVPDHLMAAIGRIESGRSGSDGQIHPWPWSINVEGVDHVFNTRDEVIAAVRAFQAQGKRSIDVGCMQVNLMYHPGAFATLEAAFDPVSNAAYAARFLAALFQQTGSWVRATAAYHSATPERGDPYQQKVAAVMAEEAGKDLALLGPGVGVPGPRLASAGAAMLGNHSEMARILPMAGGGGNRTLEAYRAAPVRVASRIQ